MRYVTLRMNDKSLLLSNEEERMKDKEVEEIVYRKLKENGVTGLTIHSIERDGVGCVLCVSLKLNLR